MAFNTEIHLTDSIIVLDAANFVNPQYNSRATEHPIEEGSSVSDHIILDNTKLDIEGVVTDSASLFGLFVTPTTTKEAFQNLLRAREKREVVSVVTEKFGTIEDLAITNFSFPRDNTTGEALDIKISFEQISIVSSSFVQESAVVFSDSIADDATASTNLGAQATSAITSSTLTDTSSALNDLIFGG